MNNRLNTTERRREKQASRDADDKALKNGEKTRPQLTAENSPLSRIVGKPDLARAGLPGSGNDRKREAVIQHDIILALGAMDGVIVWRNSIGTAQHGNAKVAYGVGGAGAPDLLCEVRCHDGAWSHLWLEIKTPDGRIEPHQTRWHRTARQDGRACCVARSKGEAIAAVDAVKRGLMPLYDGFAGQEKCEGE